MKRLLRSWLWRVPLDREVDEELALHLEMRTRELVERGMDPATARAQALGRLGDVARLKKTMTTLGRKRDRDMRLTQWLDELRDDSKFTLRQLKGSPTFTLVATLTLALGIGANSAIFALVDATLLRPLPFGDPNCLVSIWETTATQSAQLRLPAQHGRLEHSQPHVREGRGFHAERWRNGDGGRRWQCRNGLPAVGHGRHLRRARRHTHRGPYVFRRRRCQARQRGRDERGVLALAIQCRPGRRGSRVSASTGSPCTVVGVVPKDFQLMGQSSIWAMRPVVNLPPRARAAYVLHVVGRLKPGVSIQAAAADLGTVADGLAREFPQTNKGRSVTLETLHHSMIGTDLRTTSMLFLGVVGFVLLICCANVANLLLARASARTRELAVRARPPSAQVDGASSGNW